MHVDLSFWEDPRVPGALWEERREFQTQPLGNVARVEFCPGSAPPLLREVASSWACLLLSSGSTGHSPSRGPGQCEVETLNGKSALAEGPNLLPLAIVGARRAEEDFPE